MILHAEISGQLVPLSDCDWVKWAPCGCPVGVARAGEDFAVTEEDAWSEFYDRKRDSDRARRAGARMELVTQARWAAEIMPLMLARCQHQANTVSAATAAGEEQ